MTTPTDTTRATRSVDPAAEWQNILRAPRSDAAQARIEAAMDLADATVHAATRDHRP
ncbi:MAG: hypothetical protein QOE61_4240, partial [Micromonosporaceae bacterium]|nr:hypothetical protein [Micromonosporaceae bacterium]